MSLTTRVSGVLQREGIGGLVRRAGRRLLRPLRRYWYTDHTWEGRLLELLGNRATLDGAQVQTNHPLIPTKDKAALLKRTYEAGERTLLRQFPRDLPVIELGGSIGVLACITNRRLTNPDQHLVVEANPELIPILEQNRTLNRAQFQIVNAAVAYGAPQVTFYLHDKFIAGNLSQPTERSVTVDAVTLHSLVIRSGFERFGLICDIEGAEIDMMMQDTACLRDHAVWLIIEHHRKMMGAEKVEQAETALKAAGFRIVQTAQRSTCYRNDALGD